MLEARFNQIAAAKAQFFTLKDIYPKVSTQVIAFTKADKEEKTKLLPTIRQQVETWLNSFGLLLDVDKTFLSAKNEQIAKIAAQLKITGATKIQNLPPAYEVAANAFLVDFNSLNQTNLMRLNATQAEKQFLAQIAEKAIKLRLLAASLQKENPLQVQNMNSHFKNKIEVKAKRVFDLQKLAVDAPINNATQDTQNTYLAIERNVSNRLAALAQNATQPNASAATKEQFKRLQEYQNNLLEFATTTNFRVNNFFDANAGAFGRVEIDLQTGELMLSLNSNPAIPAAERERTATHEMQHMFQYQKGQIAYRNDGAGNSIMCEVLYDIFDEVDAFQMEFIVHGAIPAYEPNNSDAWTNLSNPAFIRTLDANYANLPNIRLSMDSSMADIENERLLLADELGSLATWLQNTGIMRWVTAERTATEIQIPLTAARRALTFRQFLDLLRTNYPTVLTNARIIHK